MKKINVPMMIVRELVRTWVANYKGDSLQGIIGVSRGGSVVAEILRSEFRKVHKIDLPTHTVAPFSHDALKNLGGRPWILADDIYDTGATWVFFEKDAEKWGVQLIPFFIIDKRLLSIEKDAWYVFPWETDEDIVGGREQAVVSILRSIGEDPNREGLKDTPKRVSRTWEELTCGYKQDPKEILSAMFDSSSYDEMIVVKDIEFFSLCEHHALPFHGSVHFAYIPGKKVVGLSKVARLVECFSRRLQIQERLTMEIGKTFEEIVQPKGVAVVVQAQHLCMMMRGIKKENSEMVTSYLGGCFKKEIATRQEFFNIISNLKGEKK